MNGVNKQKRHHENGNQMPARFARENRERKAPIDDKLSSLRQNAFALIREVRELAALSYRDLTAGINLQDELRKFEIRLIRQALKETDGNQTAAAQLLGLKMTTLNEKIRRFQIDPHGY